MVCNIIGQAVGTGVDLVDLYELTEGKRELFGPDGLHPSPEGAKVIAEAIVRTLRTGSL